MNKSKGSIQSFFHNPKLNEQVPSVESLPRVKSNGVFANSESMHTTPKQKKVKPKSTDILPPKAVLPYFLRLLLTNQVRSKESKDVLERARKNKYTCTVKHSEEYYTQLETEEGVKSRESVAALAQEIGEGGDYVEPQVLKTAAAAGFYLDKNIGRRGGAGKTNLGIDDPLHRRWSRTVWRKEVENLEPEYRLPALILKKHLYIKNEEPTRLGPGTYDVLYEEYAKKKRLEATRGIMKSCSRRFPKEVLANQNPGPGVYGYPFEQQDKAKREGRHSGKVSLFLSGPCDVRGQTFRGGDAGPGPGQYHVKGAIDQLLHKTVSLRGPYDLYTPDRLIIPYGYHKTLKVQSQLGPGQYNVRKSLKHEMNVGFNKYKGRFSPHNRVKKVTGERISLVSPLWPSPSTELFPGPGHYDVELNTIGKDKKQNKYAFKTSSFARPKDTSDYDMGPTKYRPEIGPKYCPLGCGHTSNFKSKTGRLDQLKIAVLSERVRPKDIPHEERVAWNNY